MEIRKLNMLRGMAALIVVVSHFSNSSKWLNASLGSGAGQFGVMIFFILSGFLMSFLYSNKGFTVENIKKYAVARTARVVPLFLLVIITSYVLSANGFQGLLYKIPNIKHFLSHLLLIKGESVLWTIGPEIQFYIVFILIWKATQIKLRYPVILLAISLIALFFLKFPRPNGIIYGFPYDFAIFQSLPYFLIGVIMGIFYTRTPISESSKSSWYILSLILIPLLYPKIFFYLTSSHHKIWADIGIFAIVSLVFFSIVFMVPDKNKLLSNKVGDFLGKISYSLYLLHLPILWQIEKHISLSIEPRLLVFILCSLLISFLSYKHIEVPSSKFIRRMLQTQ